MRALDRSGWSVAGADDRRLPLGLKSRYCASPCRQLPAEQAEDFMPRLLELLGATGPDVLIPSRCIEAVCRAQEQLPRGVRTLLPGAGAFEALNDKALLVENCEALDVPVARCFGPVDGATLLRDVPGTVLVVKPRRDVGGGRGVRFVRDVAELEAAVASAAAAYGDTVITEYVPGPVENLRALHLLFDRQSRLVAFFVLRKLRLWPTDYGVTVAAESTHEVDLVRGLLPLFEKLRWQGPADAELKLDAQDGLPKVLEINPRFSGAIQFPIACGIDFATDFANAAVGEKLESSLEPRYAAGVRYVDFAPWTRAALREIRHADRRLAALRRLRSELRAPRVPSVHSFNDPAPLIGKALMMFSAKDA